MRRFGRNTRPQRRRGRSGKRERKQARTKVAKREVMNVVGELRLHRDGSPSITSPDQRVLPIDINSRGHLGQWHRFGRHRGMNLQRIHLRGELSALVLRITQEDRNQLVTFAELADGVSVIAAACGAGNIVARNEGPTCTLLVVIRDDFRHTLTLVCTNHLGVSAARHDLGPRVAQFSQLGR